MATGGLSPCPPGPGTSGPSSQGHAYLLQLVDTLFHAADGGQRAERLGVQTPEAVLPADLEECYDPALLPTKQNSHVTPRVAFPGADTLHSAGTLWGL